jgi:hypothetical protein
VVVVHHLDERLNAGSARNLSAGHGLSNLQGGLVDTSKDGVTVGTLGSGVTLIEVLQNNGFTAGEFTASNDDDFTRLQTVKIINKYLIVKYRS